MTELKDKHPFDVELYSHLYRIYNITGQLEESLEILKKINYNKPSAITPYMNIKSLHHSVSYDSIFGEIDVMKLWEEGPTPEELGNSNFWLLLNRDQKLVFQSGVVLKDVHYGYVLLDEEVISSMQEFELGFYPSSDFSHLIVGRRLRKNEAPLSGEISGSKIIFQDLQPGDAVEIHYRLWESNNGDLWNDFWDSYSVNEDFFQRYWEYNIITEKESMQYSVSGDVGQPTISDYYGFKKYSWVGERTPAWDLQYYMVPPTPDFMGRIFVSTIADWNNLNSWYSSVSKAILGNNPRIESLVEKLLEGGETDYIKLAKLYEYIVTDLPYQTIRLDYHSSIPHKPDIVIRNQWGDCKDKGHLLIKMLEKAGIDAWPVLVQTRDFGTTMPVPQFSFDHLIICTVINGDTIFVDATDLSFPPEHSISKYIAGQPCLNIKIDGWSSLSELPAIIPTESMTSDVMKLSPDGTGKYNMIFNRKFYNLEAGYRRFDIFGKTTKEIIKESEFYWTSDWKMNVSVDSLWYDSSNSIDSLYEENWYGVLTLRQQLIGSATIVNLPNWSTIPQGLLTYLLRDPKFNFPVDLNSYCGKYGKRLEIQIPDEIGIPDLGKDIYISDTLMTFNYKSTWDEKERIVTLSYDLEIEDGLVDAQLFYDFSRKVIDTFEKPLLLKSD